MQNLANQQGSVLRSTDIHMPLLDKLKQHFKTLYGDDFAKMPHRDDTLFVIVQHGFVSIKPMMDSLMGFGIKPERIFLTTKPHTTPESMRTYFEQTFANYVLFHWHLPEDYSYASGKHPYTILSELTCGDLLKKISDHLFVHPKLADITNIVICDEGGRFLAKFIENIEKFKGFNIVAVEHTRCGTRNAALCNLPFPYINMAESFPKIALEAPLIANSMFRALGDKFRQIISNQQNPCIGVVGCGAVGEQVLHHLLKKHPDLRLIAFDKIASKVIQIKQRYLKEEQNSAWQRLELKKSLNELFEAATIILGCTGCDILKDYSIDQITHNKPETHLMSFGSGVNEFESFLVNQKVLFRSVDDIKDLTFSDNKGQSLVISNAGFPVNFSPKEEADLLPKEAQLPRSLKLASIVQALELLQRLPSLSRHPNAKAWLQGFVKLAWQLEITRWYGENLPEDVRYDFDLSNITQDYIDENADKVGVAMPTDQQMREACYPYFENNENLTLGAALIKVMQVYDAQLSVVKKKLNSYVPTQVKKRSPSQERVSEEARQESCDQMMNDFLAGEEKLLLLLGEPGSGKSLFTWSQTQKIYQAQLNDVKGCRWLPIVIDLQGYNLSNLKGLLSSYLSTQPRADERDVRGCSLSFEELSLLRGSGQRKGYRLLVILDGFDQLTYDDESEEQAFRDCFKTCCQYNPTDLWHDEQIKLIVTCRSGHLDDLKEKRYFGHADQQTYQCHELLPLKNDQVIEYVHKHAKPEQLTACLTAIKESYDIQTLVKNPLNLVTLVNNPNASLEEINKKYAEFSNRNANRGKPRHLKKPSSPYPYFYFFVLLFPLTIVLALLRSGRYGSTNHHGSNYQKNMINDCGSLVNSSINAFEKNKRPRDSNTDNFDKRNSQCTYIPEEPEECLMPKDPSPDRVSINASEPFRQPDFHEDDLRNANLRSKTFVEKIVRIGSFTPDINQRYNVPAIPDQGQDRKTALVPHSLTNDVVTNQSYHDSDLTQLSSRQQQSHSRGQLLQSIQHYFDESDTGFIDQVLVDAYDYRVLKGNGGVGKTVLAKLFAETQWRKPGYYQLIRWIDANDNLEHQFSLFLKEVFGVDEQLIASRRTAVDVVASVYASLSNVENWLLIFDNVEDESILENYKPDKYTKQLSSASTHGRRHCLITSRHPNWDGAHVTKIGGFTQVEIISYARRFFDVTDYTEASLIELAIYLNYHPLGVVHAIHYLDNYRRYHDQLLSMQDFLNQLTQEPEPRLSVHHPHPEEYGWDAYALNTLKTLSLSLQLLIESTDFSKYGIDRDSSLRLMQHVLRCLAYLQRTDIPDQIINTIVSKVVNVPQHECEKIVTVIIRKMISYNIIEHDAQYNRIVVHQLMQRSLQFSRFEDGGESLIVLLQSLHQHFDYDPDVLTTLERIDYRRWISQIEALLEHSNFPHTTENMAQLITLLHFKLGRYYAYETKSYAQARAWLEKSSTRLMATNTSDIQPYQSLKATLYSTLSLVFYYQGLRDDSEEYANKSLALWGDSTQQVSQLSSVEALIQLLKWNVSSNVRAEQILPPLTLCIDYLAANHSTASLSYTYLFVQAYSIRAEAALNQGHINQTTLHLDQVEKNLRRKLPETHFLFETLLDYRIKVSEKANNIEQLKNYSQQAITLADKTGSFSMIELRYRYQKYLLVHQQYEQAQQISLTIIGLLEKDRALLEQYTAHQLSITHLAAKYNDTQTLQWLIDENVDLDTDGNFNQMTPLSLAVSFNHTEIVRLLIKNKVRINHVNTRGYTALNLAAEDGYADIAELLLEQGVAIDKVNQWGSTPLHRAATNGHLSICQLLVQHGATISAVDQWHSTPLIRAAEQGQSRICEFLLSQGAFINQQDANGWTALHGAAFAGHLDVVELLLANNATIDQQNKNGATPLYLAAEKGHLNVCRLLLKNDAMINQHNRYGKIPLYVAAENGYADVSRLLLENGAAVNYAENDGWTALGVASVEGHLNVVKLLLANNAKVDQPNKHGLTPLYLAAQKGHVDVYRFLYAKNFVVNWFSRTRDKLFLLAAEKGHVDVCRFLLANFAVVNYADPNGWTALHVAAYAGHLEVIKLLLTNNATVDKPTNNGLTLLYLAAANGYVDVCRLLLANGATVNYADSNGWTALHGAAFSGHLNVVELLLANHASIDKQNKDGSPPLYLAAEKGHVDVCRLLLASGAAVNYAKTCGWTALHWAAQNGHADVCRLLLAYNGKVDEPTKNGATPLYLAAENGRVDVCRLLLASGANADHNIDGFVALHIAAHDGYLEIVQLLLANNAKVNQLSKEGATSLHHAAENGHTNVCRLLLANGASVNHADSYGWTALHFAAQNGHFHVCRLLLANGASANQIGHDGSTPIYLAVKSNQSTITELLLHHNVLVHQRKQDVTKLLRIAKTKGYHHIYQLLLDKDSSAKQQVKNAIETSYFDFFKLWNTQEHQKEHRHLRGYL